MHLIVAYDVPDNTRRTRLAKGLEGFLVRVQKSVFEGEIPTQRLEALYHLIETETDLSVDSVRIYRLCRRCVSSVDVLGLGSYIGNEGDEIV